MFCQILLCVAVAAAVSGKNCDSTTCNIGLIKYYNELNCRAVQKTGECCPYMFDCTDALSNRAPDKCHVGGVSYPIGARLTQEQTGSKCIAECACQAENSLADLNCAEIECPEDMGVDPPPGCVYTYSHDLCCSNGTICGTTPVTCKYGEKSFRVGEKFFQDDEPCQECICQKGFDGTLREPWCQEISCEIQANNGEKIRNGCAPIHYGSEGCCPIGWRCPYVSDSVMRSNSTTAETEGSPECVFGKLRLKVGDKLNSVKSKSCVECKCTLPPHVSCVENEDCDG